MGRRGFIAGGLAGAGLPALHPFSTRAASNQAHLRVMATTDLHVHVLPYDYYTDRPLDTVGLSRIASIVRQFRAEATNALLLDNGDFLQGNPLGDYIAYERGLRDGDLHPIIAAMNAIGFDGSTLGNHEFNYGLDFLSKALARADFPVVSANVIRQRGAEPTRDIPLVAPYAILDRTVTMGDGLVFPIRIGLIGFVPPQILVWDRRHLEGRVTTRDIVEAAKAWVPQMKERGCDLIVALSHSGIGAARWTENMENASVPLAGVEGIDIVVTGHSHLVFPGPIFEGLPAVDAVAGTLHGKPAVMSGFWGSHMGLIDLLLERTGTSWRIVGHLSENRPIYRVAEDHRIDPVVEDDPAVCASVSAIHEEALAYVRRAVGRTATPLHSYFAHVANDPSVQIVATAQKWYIAQMLAGTCHEGLPILSAAAPFKVGGRGGPHNYTDVPAGDLALRHIADLYIYPNTIRAVKVSGAELLEWLERSAGLFRQIRPGVPDQPLIDPEFPSYNFDVIDGVTYRIDLSQPSRYDVHGALQNPGARRIVDLKWNGRPVADGDTFVIATNSYRAAGGGAFPGAGGDSIIYEGPVTNRDIIIRFVAEHGTINPAPEGAWGFVDLPGTSVIFETGPRASAFLPLANGPRIEAAGEGEDGFGRFRIAL